MGILFRYRAKDKNAQYKDGTIEAINEDDALSKLEKEELWVISIEKIEKKTTLKSVPTRDKKRIIKYY